MCIGRVFKEPIGSQRGKEGNGWYSHCESRIYWCIGQEDSKSYRSEDMYIDKRAHQRALSEALGGKGRDTLLTLTIPTPTLTILTGQPKILRVLLLLF